MADYGYNKEEQEAHGRLWWSIRLLILPIYYVFYILLVVPFFLVAISIVLVWINLKKFFTFLKSRMNFN